jgi:hypothetical protein
MRRLLFALVALGCVLTPVAAAAAPPPTPVLVSPQGSIVGSSHSFSWRASAGATWYQLWIADSVSSPKFLEWYTALQVQCTEGSGICTANLSIDLAVGGGQWWVRGYGSDGNSAWSNAAAFTVRHVPASWDAQLPAADRFQLVLTGAGVLDRETGLVWQRTQSSSVVGWSLADALCVAYEAGTPGRRGWRLPTLEEMLSLTESGHNPILPSGHPFLNVAAYYTWTATDSPNDSTVHWLVNLVNGFAGLATATATSNFWCVRGQPGLRSQ